MAKHTLRDEVWGEIIDRREAGETFAKADIVDVVEASERTVHDVLKTAVEADVLDTSKEQRKTRDGTQQQTVTTYAPPPDPDPPLFAIGADAIEELADRKGYPQASISQIARIVGGLLILLSILGILVQAVL